MPNSISLVTSALLLLVSSCSAATVTLEQDVTGLEYLFNSTNGIAWTYPSSSAVKWNFNTDPCSPSVWSGLTCQCTAPDYCRVTQMNMVQYNMQGTIAPELSNVNYLDKIVFQVRAISYILRNLLACIIICICCKPKE